MDLEKNKQRLEILAAEVEELKNSGGGGGDLSDYLTKDEASSTYETQTSAAATYETQSHASSTYVAKDANPLVIATYTNPTEQTNDGTANIYLGSLTNSTADSHNNTVIGYNVKFKPKTWNSVAIGYNCMIEYAKGNSNGVSSVAINGRVYGKNSVAIQGIAGVSTDTYGENRIAILGDASNRGEYLISLNSNIGGTGNTIKDWCTAINTGKQIGGGYRYISDCQDSIYMGQLRFSIEKCSGCVGIGSKYFNKNDETYNNVVAIGNDLLPSTSNCVILGSYSNDMSSSGSFFAVGNGTDDNARSNLFSFSNNLFYCGNDTTGYDLRYFAPADETLTNGGTISATALVNANKHVPLSFNAHMCYYSYEDNDNVYYTSTRLNGTSLHTNIIAINKTTGVATFNEFDQS